MDGVRVLEAEVECTKAFLWSYFGNPKYGGGDISNIYYPLLHNDAVILFKDRSVTAEVLSRKHERFRVVPLPHKVFSKIKVWVDSEMSVLVQATDSCCQSLKDQGGLDVSQDPKTEEMILEGEDYQIEWAQMYLSQLKDNQIHIANTLQRERETAAAYEYEKQRGSKSANNVMVNGNGVDRSLPDPVAALRRHVSSASAEVKSADSPSPKPRERISVQRNTDTVSGGPSPLHGSNENDDVRDMTAEIQHLTGQLHSLEKTGIDSKGPRQEDADNTFHHFASLPRDSQHEEQGDPEQTRHSSTTGRRSERDWQTEHSRADIEFAERAHRAEHHYHSLGYIDTGHSSRMSGAAGYSSIQPYLDREEAMEMDDDEMMGAHGGSRSKVYQRFLSNEPSARDIHQFALMSNASIELSRKSFDISRNLKLKIYREDITKAHTDAVVNAANWELKNIGGVAGALAKAAGPEMADECNRIYRENGKLATAQVVKTKAYGKLRHMKYVLHTVGPFYLSKDQEERNVFELAQTFLNCLEFADKLGLKTLTFPFISTGIFGMPVESCVLALVTAAKVYSEKKSCVVEEIHFVNNDINVVCEAIIMAGQRLKMETIETALQRMEDGRKSYGYTVYPYCQTFGDIGAAASASDLEEGRGRSRSRTGLQVDRTEPQSLPDLSSRTSQLRRSGSLDRVSRHHTQTPARSGDSAGHERQPSPIPPTSHSRRRSNSLTLGDKVQSTTSKKSSTLDQPARSSPKGNTGPVLKQALQPVKKKNMTVAGRIGGTPGSSSKTRPVRAVTSGGRSADNSGISDTDSASVAGSEDGDGTCPICLEPHRFPKKLPCGHTFCSQCLDRAMATKPKCPKCQRNFGIQTGTQPKNGRMTYRVDHSTHLPGYGLGVIVIEYYIPSGIQEACHPNPGRYYSSCQRTAYLPYNAEGKEVLKMLEKAFSNRLIFTIGDSHTTGASGVITWNDIHHKTSMTGGPTNFGYPDPDYLRRVKEELADRGITSP